MKRGSWKRPPFVTVCCVLSVCSVTLCAVYVCNNPSPRLLSFCVSACNDWSTQLLNVGVTAAIGQLNFSVPVYLSLTIDQHAVQCRDGDLPTLSDENINIRTNLPSYLFHYSDYRNADGVLDGFDLI